MKRESFSIAGACALGAFIGTIVALDISSHFPTWPHLWIVGALFGGIVAYIAIEFRPFCAGVARSYHRTIAWRPETAYWKTHFVIFCGLMMVVSNFIIFLEYVDHYAAHPKSWTVFFSPLSRIWVILVCTMFVTAFVMMPSHWHGRDWLKSLKEHRDMGRGMILYGNPIGALYKVIAGLVWVIVRIPSVVRMARRVTPTVVRSIRQGCRVLGRFAMEVALEVHSKRRAICFMDAVFGASVGYYFGSAVLGGLVGAVLGPIHYELISVRWLRLSPT